MIPSILRPVISKGCKTGSTASTHMYTRTHTGILQTCMVDVLMDARDEPNLGSMIVLLCSYNHTIYLLRWPLGPLVDPGAHFWGGG